MIVQDDARLLELVRYTDQNPLRANVLTELSDYRWSSHGARNARQRADGETRDQLIERLCAQYGFTEAELASASRTHDRANLRGLIELEATEKGLTSVTEIANRFGRSQPALSRAIIKLRHRHKL